jgi:hypothetical protein
MGWLSFREPERGEECSLHPIVAFQWPSASTAQPVGSIRHIADPAPQSLEFRRVLSADSKHKRQSGKGLAVTSGRAVLSIGEVFPFH